jgi:hypothetical protein
LAVAMGIDIRNVELSTASMRTNDNRFLFISFHLGNPTVCSESGVF